MAVGRRERQGREGEELGQWQHGLWHTHANASKSCTKTESKPET